MIVIGYQGIGKSTLCRNENGNGYIDLESGLMKDPMNDNKRWDNWANIYCNIALSLSGQGYVVFVSSHKVVQDILAFSDEPIIAIYPSQKLQEPWIEKLRKRWEKTRLAKDENAYLDAKANYAYEIYILENSPFVKCKLESMEYNLKYAFNSAAYTLAVKTSD